MSLNCRRFFNSLPEIYDLTCQYDVICLQETWLAKQLMYHLSNVNNSFYAVGTFSFDYQDGLLKGRPHGGTAILYKKWLKTTLKSKDDTICGLSIDCGNKTLCLINAYLPYYYSANVDGYLQYLSDLTPENPL